MGAPATWSRHALAALQALMQCGLGQFVPALLPEASGAAAARLAVAAASAATVAAFEMAMAECSGCGERLAGPAGPCKVAPAARRNMGTTCGATADVSPQLHGRWPISHPCWRGRRQACSRPVVPAQGQRFPHEAVRPGPCSFYAICCCCCSCCCRCCRFSCCEWSIRSRRRGWGAPLLYPAEAAL